MGWKRRRGASAVVCDEGVLSEKERQTAAGAGLAAADVPMFHFPFGGDLNSFD